MTAPSQDNIDRFRLAFVEIEKHLRDRLNVNKDDSCVHLIKSAEAKGVLGHRDMLALLDYVDLRNNISHKAVHGQYLAIPQDFVVRNIERICRHLVRPVTVRSKFLFKVQQADLEAPLMPVLEVMRHMNISQVPVYEQGKQFKGLMTNNAVARWLAAKKDDGIVDLDDARVHEVMPFVEEQEQHGFATPETPLIEVVSRFSEYAQQGKQLVAVIITHSGTPHQTPLGIIAVSDIPTALSEIDNGP